MIDGSDERLLTLGHLFDLNLIMGADDSSSPMAFESPIPYTLKGPTIAPSKARDKLSVAPGRGNPTWDSMAVISEAVGEPATSIGYLEKYLSNYPSITY